MNNEEYKYFLPKITARNIPYGEHAKNTWDGQLKLLPKEVVYCKKCVLSNQRPRTTFDDHGVCSACHYTEYKKNIDWNARKKMFDELCAQYRRSDGRYDVLVPSSGGKDSGALAHRLKYEHGMNPLSITWSPLLYTNIGMLNIQNMILSGVANNTYSPNRILQRKFSKLFFVLHGDHFETFSRGTMNFPFHVALKEGIKLIMFGENAEVEYGGGAKKELPYNTFEDWERFYHKHNPLSKVLKFGVEEGYLEESDLNDPSLRYYSLPPLEDLKKTNTVARWYGWYFNWVPQENYYYAAENYGFQAMPRRTEATYSKYASIDDLTDPFHYYMSLIKFGIGRATSDAAHEIRDGHLLREEGVALVRKYDREFPAKHFKTFLQYIDMKEEEFWEVVDAYRSVRPNIWEKSSGEWSLRCQVT